MKRFFVLMILVVLTLTACGPKGPVTLTVMTHDSFAASEGVISAFEKANNVKVAFLKSGDAGAALNKAILTNDAPLADVFYGVDNTFLSRALDAGIYTPYASPLLAKIPEQFKLDPQNRALPVDYGDVCINYDKAYFSSHYLPVPATLEDLEKPAYKDCWSWKTRPHLRPVWPSCWQRSSTSVRRLTWITGSHCAPMVWWWWIAGRQPITPISAARPGTARNPGGLVCLRARPPKWFSPHPADQIPHRLDHSAPVPASVR